MRNLTFRVTGQKIEKEKGCDFSGLIKGTKGYLRARFIFDAEWDGYKKAAVFFDHKGKEQACPIVDGECEIPAKATAGERFEISVAGAKGSHRIRTGRLTIRQGR